MWLIFQPCIVSAMKWNTTDREVMLPENFNCDKCQVAVKSLNSSCDDSETAVWDMGPIPICKYHANELVHSSLHTHSF